MKRPIYPQRKYHSRLLREGVNSCPEELGGPFHRLLDPLRLAAVILDPDETICYCNNYFLEVTDWKMDDLVGKDWFTTIIPTELRLPLKVFYTTSLNNSLTTSSTTHEILTKNHQRRMFEWNNTTLMGLNGKPSGIVSIGVDITSHLKVELNLERTEETTRTIFNAMPDLICIINADGKIASANQAFTSRVNKAIHEVIGSSIFDYRAPDLIDLSRETFLELLDTGRAIRRERVTSRGYFRDSINAILDDKGHVSQIALFIRDITQQKKAEAAEREQNQLAQALRATAEALTTEINLDDLLDAILANIEKVVPHDSANIMLAESGVARVVRMRGYPTRGSSSYVERMRFPIQSTQTLQYMNETHLPILISNTANRQDWLETPETSWISSYVGAPIYMNEHLFGFIGVNSQTPSFFTQTHAERLQAFAYQAAIAFNNAEMFKRLQDSHISLSTAYDDTIAGWARALELRDKITEGHTRRVAQLSVRLAELMGISGERLVEIYRGAQLHDIGKIAIPDSILSKPSPLNPQEWEIMHQHPRYAYEMLSIIDYLKPTLDIPYCHHEKWDGSGYPQGLRGEEIPLPARIFAIVDVWDALQSERPYSLPWEKQKAIDYIRSESGKHFDPGVVEIFLSMV
jgi:PAS domain S-box-containing protein